MESSTRVVPTTKDEYKVHEDALADGSLDLKKLQSDIAMWQRKKGGLLSQSWVDEADEVQEMIKRMAKINAFAEAREAFIPQQNPTTANKLIVAFDNLDSQHSALVPHAWHKDVYVAQAATEMLGGHILSAMSRLAQISGEDS